MSNLVINVRVGNYHYQMTSKWEWSRRKSQDVWRKGLIEWFEFSPRKLFW